MVDVGRDRKRGDGAEHAGRTPAAGGSSPLVARLQVVAAALLFSTGGAAIKATTLDSWQVASFRSGVAAVALFALLPAARRRWSPGVLAVAVAYATTMLLYVAANKATTAANTIFLQSTAPLYILLLAPWLLRERIRRLDVAYMAVLAVGMALFFVGVVPRYATAPHPFRGNLLAAGAGLSWALAVVGLRALGREEGRDRGVAAVVAGNVLACLVALPWALPVAGVRAADGVVIGYLGLVQVGLAYIFLTAGIRRVEAFQASLLLLVEPVLNPVWAWLAHGEKPGAWALGGGALILSATAAKTWVDARRRDGGRLGRGGAAASP